MSRSLGKKIFKGFLWTLAGLVILIITIPALLYVPFIQSWAKDIALKEVNRSTGMNISIESLRLRFPLKLSLEGVQVIEATGDTMAVVGSVGLNVKLMPLFSGDVEIGRAELDSVRYQMGNADSLMWLRASVRRAVIDAGAIRLAKSDINLDNATIDGADINLIMKPDTAETPVDTAAAAPWHISARAITLRDIRYRMTMMPVIDSLDTYVGIATLRDGTVDMASHSIRARSLSVDSVTAAYFTPSAKYLAEHPVAGTVTETAATPDSLMWTVTADSLSLTGRRALYAMRDAVPLPGLDMNYIEVTDIAINVDSFYNRGTSIRVPLRRLHGVERCGVELNASGLFEMDSTMMRATRMDISTLYSDIRLDGSMGVGTFTDPALPLRLLGDARLSMADVRLLYPSLSPIVSRLPNSDLNLHADIDGTPAQLNVYDLRAFMPGLIKMTATGQVENLNRPEALGGEISLDGYIDGLNNLKPTLLEARLAKQVNIPMITLNGTVNYHPQNIEGHLTATTLGGEVVMEGLWNGRSEDYDLDLDIDRLPVGKIMPSLGVGSVTASLKAKGHGYNPLSPSTDLDVDLDVAHIEYSGENYRDITLTANASGGKASGRLESLNPGADLDVDFTAEITREACTWNLDGEIRDLNLLTLKLSETENHGSLSLTSTGTYNTRNGDIDASATVDRIDWTLPDAAINTSGLDLSLLSNDSTLRASLANGDMRLNLDGYCRLDSFLTRITRASDILTAQINDRQVDVNAIQQALPGLRLTADMGDANVVSEYLASTSGMKFDNFTMALTNDSVINMSARVLGFVTGSTKLDSISLDLNQKGKYLVYTALINNRPGTMDQFAHVSLNGYIAYDRLSAVLRQSNIKGEKGFQLGLRANMTDSVATLKFVPYHPTIAYQEWTINQDNFITFNFITKHLDANLALSNDKSYLHLFTEHVDNDSIDGAPHQEDVVLQVSDIHLQDWLSISPFAPPIKGDISADMKFRWDAKDITGHGTVGISDLYYGRDRVGTFDLDLSLTNSANGAIHAEAALLVDSIKTITAIGALNDSTQPNPFLLDFSMIRFPLNVVNPFLPPGTAKLQGTLNGRMDITGDLANPMFNGFLDFDSAAVKVTMLGTLFNFSDSKIPVDSNIVRFNNFAIHAANDNPLTINGTVDVRQLSNIGIDLDLQARNMMIVNSTRPHGADVYGKAYIDLDADVKGNMSFINVDAALSLLSGTNVTYVSVMTDGASAITSRSTGDMVKFVQLSDTTQVLQADSITQSAMAMNLDAILDIQEGTTINVDLSTDGKNRVQIQSSGELTYSMNPMNDGRLTGRLNINKGFVRYTPPFMSEKLFNFQEGSYVAFNGDMLNPILNIHAVDELKANVTQEGQNSRLVNFDVSLAVTNTLDNMNVAFDLSTNDDITVQNELQSMSPEQRANQAMNLLLYNVYSGAGTSATANLSGNPLYSFLESQINSWAAQNIKGVDITFGIDQYNKTLDGNTSTTTSYSYRVSKTLFNDRFKIVVGGNYSTDADADENFSQNLINDISFEYMLNRSGSMYVKIFRHTGYESILEGEVTQTGVGFVIKRKIHSLRDLFRFRSAASGSAPLPALPVPADNSPKPSGEAVIPQSSTHSTAKDNDKKD